MLVDLLAFLPQRLAAASQYETAAVAQDQLSAECFFELLQRRSHGRLLDKQPLGGLRDAPLLRDHQEGSQQVPIQVSNARRLEGHLTLSVDSNDFATVNRWKQLLLPLDSGPHKHGQICFWGLSGWSILIADFSITFFQRKVYDVI